MGRSTELGILSRSCEFVKFKHLHKEMAQAGEEIAQLICAKKIDPMISRVFKFEQLPEALTQVATRQTNGKVVVLVD
ncbi:MAG: zinc-binding dehydrogenase [Bacteroidales bacterium]